MASQSALPRFLAWVHPRARTPASAIALSLLVSVAFALTGNLGLVAGATNFAIFVGFAAVNIGRMPIMPLTGLGCVAFLMANLERDALLVGSGLFLTGVVAMEVLQLWRPQA